MGNHKQLAFPFAPDETNEAASNNPYSGREIGTFKDSMRAPIFGWFRYPAGYSYKFVNESFDLFNVRGGDWVYDPFSGSGTTLICAKKQGINGYGVEAHSFVHWVANVKLYWDFNIDQLRREIRNFIHLAETTIREKLETVDVEGIFPDLIYKCYHPLDLRVLFLLREIILNEIDDIHFRDLLKLALTDTLRGAAIAGTGWPYVSPRKNDGTQPPKNAFLVFQSTVWKMYEDLKTVIHYDHECQIQNVYGDSAQQQPVEDGLFKLALTSPPYLNNYDYADRTRLETYFWGITQNWADITAQFRDRLIVAATTQVTRKEHNIATILSDDIRAVDNELYTLIQTRVEKLAQLRRTKGGKKDYDMMTALYFNSLLRIVQETYRMLSPEAHFLLVLGDSAPYGVHIPTDDFIGKMGLGIGFRSYNYHELRKRGDKWKDNPQRHRVPLREGIVILQK